MAHILALSGWRRSGKDTIGNYLAEKHGFKKISFAGALKDAASELFQINRQLFDDDVLKDKPILSLPLERKSDKTSQLLVSMLSGEFGGSSEKLFYSPRTLCILLGAVGRVVSNDFWVKKAIKGLQDNQNYVITDLRFVNEIESLYNSVKTHKIYTIRINRFSDITSTNPSERDLDTFSFDFTLKNRDSLEALYSQIETNVIARIR